jgi:NAD(P)-dependent dehydrogenase (short-subunit alcohol dehydrogenase family)
MERALIMGDTGGIGAAVAAALRAQNVQVTGLSRKTGFDITNPAKIDAVLQALTGPFDMIFIATGVLAPSGTGPEKSLVAVNARNMAEVFAVNTIGPALILRHAARLLSKDRPSVIGVLSARVGSIGDNQMGGWYSYRASKAALNQIVRSAAIELGRSHRQAVCVALHPGTVETEFTSDYAGRHAMAAPEVAAKQLLSVCAQLTPRETGGFFDYNFDRVPW